MDNEHIHEGYMLPPLSDEFLFQIIFCMEDQANEYCIDLKDGIVSEIEFVEDRRAIEPQRFLDLPPWYPSDGFRTMEKFVSTLRNPIYRERLRQVLQSGKGVFRQFKDVLHEQPSLERLWYYYKDKEIRRRIFHWYERHDEAFRLARLGEEAPDEGSKELVREDFVISEDAKPYEDEIQDLGDLAVEKARLSEHACVNHVVIQIRESWQKHQGDAHLVALTLSGEFAAFIRYHIYMPDQIAVVRCYGVLEEFQGLGVFHYLIDSLCITLAKHGVRELIIRFAGDSLRIERMFEVVGPTDLIKTISISIPRWNDEISHTEKFSYE